MTYGVIIDGETYVAEIADDNELVCVYCELWRSFGCDLLPDGELPCNSADTATEGKGLNSMKRVIFAQPVKESKS